MKKSNYYCLKDRLLIYFSEIKLQKVFIFCVCVLKSMEIQSHLKLILNQLGAATTTKKYNYFAFNSIFFKFNL